MYFVFVLMGEALEVQFLMMGYGYDHNLINHSIV